MQHLLLYTESALFVYIIVTKMIRRRTVLQLKPNPWPLHLYSLLCLVFTIEEWMRPMYWPTCSRCSSFARIETWKLNLSLNTHQYDGAIYRPTPRKAKVTFRLVPGRLGCMLKSCWTIMYVCSYKSFVKSPRRSSFLLIMKLNTYRKIH